MMRKMLEFVYAQTLVLAAFCLVCLLVSVLLGIFSRQLNFFIPGLEAYPGYFMAASGSLALANTLKRGEHIHVTLVLNALPGPWKKIGRVWALGATFFLALLFAFYSCKLVWQSYVLMDISTFNDATPLWIPQFAMAIGTVVLAIAVLDELLLEVMGKRANQQNTETVYSE